MKLNLRSTLYNHQRMWRWIANNTESRRKRVTEYDYFNDIPEYEVPLNLSFACSYANSQRDLIDIILEFLCKIKLLDQKVLSSHMCKKCPFDWEKSSGPCPCNTHLRNEFINITQNDFDDSEIVEDFDPDKINQKSFVAAYLARQIADTPLKKKYQKKLNKEKKKALNY